ncbi:Wzz/FepE/Etk N-terminal domain-containing protein [Modestobacter sp. VKM Ac-2986]|uniref:YveK family protein n=1 Tax=Modestobacter sp. VKM Ac-2986 TaxID=3004140 RepID=UPI0022ABAB8B|nr:Wzz/FepE/Etk N-terminal domain-containing protein [Modestobacter sp. VKM Ac-2986]MCZ2830223.1 Wzz/FepE/Etk N-terminal domain-containing protein [Modestobacter sp. VKM Ac-2986]
MELKDYVGALRRHWRVGAGTLLVCLVLAGTVVLVAPRTYQATAQVFVSSSAQGTASPQFISARVESYPDVAVSAAVLDPAEDDLQLGLTVQQLRGHLSAVNPSDTSQINITASFADAETAAAVANAVAEQFTGVVEELEQPGTGTSPVALTVTNPATAPVSPATPQALPTLLLGLVVGLFLGLAASIVRSRLDPTVHDEDGVRQAWGPDPDLAVLSAPTGRRQGALSGRPAATLARRLDLLGDDRPGSVLVLSPSPAEQAAATAFAADLARELAARDVPTVLDDADPAAVASGAAPVSVSVTDPLAPVAAWRRAAGSSVVLVVPTGRVVAADVTEVRTLLGEVGATVLALVLTPPGPRHRPAPITGAGTDPAAAAPGTPAVVPAPRAAAAPSPSPRATPAPR